MPSNKLQINNMGEKSNTTITTYNTITTITTITTTVSGSTTSSAHVFATSAVAPTIITTNVLNTPGVTPAVNTAVNTDIGINRTV